jgi:hypothetical protein
MDALLPVMKGEKINIEAKMVSTFITSFAWSRILVLYIDLITYPSKIGIDSMDGMLYEVATSKNWPGFLQLKIRSWILGV